MHQQAQSTILQFPRGSFCLRFYTLFPVIRIILSPWLAEVEFRQNSKLMIVRADPDPLKKPTQLHALFFVGRPPVETPSPSSYGADRSLTVVTEEWTPSAR